MIGRKLLHYEIVARLGAGGMGEVWRAVDPRLQRDVAIKIVPSTGADAPLLRERFVREARAASALAHPNIITIHEINAADGLDFIVMEYVRGETLAEMLERGPLTVARAVEYAGQIAAALEAAHAAGIVHRDLKPGNVMIAASGLVKVLDFGIAKRMSSAAAQLNSTTEAALTVLGESIGTPAYMSPEQALGDPVDVRSDVYSFGVVLYQMLTGRLPYQATTKLSLVRQIVHEPPTPLQTAAPQVPDSVVSIVDRCLVKDPGGRYAGAAPLGADLRRCTAHLPDDTDASEAETRSFPVPGAQARNRRVPLRAVAIAAGVALIMYVAWARGPSLVQWLRTQATPQAQLPDADAPAPELYSRAVEDLRFYYREGNVDRAITLLDRAVALRSSYPSAEARLSLAYWRKNFLSADSEWQKRALAHAERAVGAGDQLAVAHIAHGAALALGGHLDEAAAAYQKAETLEPANWELLGRLGDLAVARKSITAAEQYYRRATESGPREWEPHGLLGIFLYRQGRYPEAIAAFEKMRELAPDHMRAYSNLAAAYHQLGRTDEAARVLQRALEIAPDSVTYSNLGTYLYFQGKYPEAVSAFEAAVKLNPNASARWGNLGDAARMATPGSEKMHESYRRAVQLARSELTKRPADPNIQSSLALYLVRDGQGPAALSEIDQVLRLQNLPPSVLFKGALVVELANQRSRALSLLGRALDAGYQLREISAEPDLVSLRADPEYHKLVSRYEK